MNTRLTTACASALALLSGGCGANGETPGFILFPGMVESVPYDAYDEHSQLGQASRLPPPDTVPYQTGVFPYGSGEPEAQRAGLELVNPIPNTKAELARGKVVFERFCVVCHGTGGDGDGPIIGRFPNPPSLKGGHTRGMRDGQMFHVMTRGQGIMVAYAVQVSAEDRWRMVHYIRNLQGTGVRAPVVAKTSTAADADVSVVATASTATTTDGSTP